MAVNENIYGSKSTWIGTNFKFPNFGDDKTTLNDGFTNTKLALNKPLDSSVVHSALGAESVLSHLHYYGNLQEYATDNYNPLQFTFASGTDDISNRRSTLNVTSTAVSLHDGMITPETKKGTGLNGVSPVIDFDYKRLRALIKVHVSANKNDYTAGSVQEYTLKEYIDNHTAEYPYIRDTVIELYNVENGIASVIDGTEAKGLILYNTVSLYKPFKNSATSYYEECNTGLMYCCYNNFGTRYNNKIIIYGLLSYDPDATSHIYHINKNYVGVFSDGVTIESDSTYSYCYKEYYTGFQDYIMHQTACFGIQFVTDTDYLTIDLEDETTTDEQAENVFIGVLDNNFVGHGDFVNGKAVKNTKQYGLNSANDSPFDPSNPLIDNDLNSNRNNTTGVYSGGKMFVVDNLGIDSMINALCGVMTGDIVSDEDRYKMSLNFGDKSPLDYVSSFRFCPFTITGGTATNTINVFNKPITATDTVFHPLLTSIKRVKTSINVPRLFNDFRAYAPYTTLQLYVPFCDTIELNPSEWYEQRLTLDYFFNFATGDVTCSVMLNDLDFAVLTGTFLYDIPLTAENNNAYRIAISSLNIDSKYNDINTLISQVNTGANVISNAVTGNVGGMLSSFTGMISNSVNHAETREKLDLQYQATKPTLCKSGSANATNNFMLDFDGKLIYKYRNFDMNFDNYADTVGYACFKNGSLSECSHLTKMTNTKINVSLPQDIINAMTSALNTGVIM